MIDSSHIIKRKRTVDTAQVRLQLSNLIVAAGAFMTAFLSYSALLSRNYNGDGLQFVLSIESKYVAGFFQSNHLLYSFVGFIVYELWRFLGWDQGAIIPLQILNAFGGALGLALFSLVVWRITKRWTVVLIATVGLGASLAYWEQSTDVEDEILSVALVILSVWFLLRSEDTGSRRRALFLIVSALATAVGTLLLQTKVLFVPASLWFLLSGPYDDSPSARWKRLLIWLGVFGSVVGIPYILVAITVYHVTTPLEFLRWLLSPTEIGLWGEPTVFHLPKAVYGFAKSFMLYPGMERDLAPFWQRANTPDKILFAIFNGTLFVILASPVLYALVHWRKGWNKTFGRETIFCLIWFATFALFNLYWVPGDPQFWVITLVPWWWLAAMIITDLGQKYSPQKGRVLFRSFLIVSLLFTVNLGLRIIPNHDLARNRPYQISQFVAGQVSASDLVITPGGDALFLYIPYFVQRKTFSVFHVLLHDFAKDRSATFCHLSREIQKHRETGTQVYVIGLSATSGTNWEYVAKAGLDRQDFNQLSTHFVAQYGDETLEKVVKVPESWCR